MGMLKPARSLLNPCFSQHWDHGNLRAAHLEASHASGDLWLSVRVCWCVVTRCACQLVKSSIKMQGV